MLQGAAGLQVDEVVKGGVNTAEHEREFPVGVIAVVIERPVILVAGNIHFSVGLGGGSDKKVILDHEVVARRTGLVVPSLAG